MFPVLIFLSVFVGEVEAEEEALARQNPK